LNSLKNVFLLALIFVSSGLYSQEIVTASQYFNQVSDRYGALTDYSAQISIQQGKEFLQGMIYYRSPNRMRIDFTSPSNMVINTDGKLLTVYLPKYSVSFTQELKKRSDASLAAMASRQGLVLLKNNYSIGYAIGPEPVPLDDKSPDKVVKLKLTWRSGGQAFRQLEIDVGQNGFIRRITGVTVALVNVQFDFSNIKPNTGIPDSRFSYDSPPTSNVINNFLFEPEN
jgi:outer membrane lipoprotein-sorting protein